MGVVHTPCTVRRRTLSPAFSCVLPASTRMSRGHLSCSVHALLRVEDAAYLVRTLRGEARGAQHHHVPAFTLFSSPERFDPRSTGPPTTAQDRTHWAAEGRGAFVREAGSTVDQRIHCAEFSEKDEVRTQGGSQRGIASAQNQHDSAAAGSFAASVSSGWSRRQRSLSVSDGASARAPLVPCRRRCWLQGLVIVGSASHNTPETQAFVSDYKARAPSLAFSYFAAATRQLLRVLTTRQQTSPLKTSRRIRNSSRWGAH